MKKLLILLVGLLSLASFQGQGQTIKETIIQVPYTSGSTPTRTALLYLPIGYPKAGVKYPLIIFMHGAGESLPGTPTGSTLYNSTSAGGPSYVIEHAAWPDSFRNFQDGKFYQPIVVSPFSANGWSTTGDECEILKNFMRLNYPVDTNRIYTTGLSAGGAGATEDAAHLDPNEANQNSVKRWFVAAFVPMSEASNQPQPAWGVQIAKDSIRGWGYGNYSDVHGAITSALIDAINNAVAAKNLGRFSVYTQGAAQGGHCCWNLFYDPNYRENFTWKNHLGQTVTANMNIYEWMLLNVRSFVSVTSAYAGPDQTIVTPVSAVFLQGSGTPSVGHTISTYQWIRQSGPVTANILTPNAASTNVSGLVPGVYVFQLTVTDNVGATANSVCTVTVVNGIHPPPSVSATPDQTIALNITSVPVTSNPSFVGTIASYSWTKYPYLIPKIKVGIIGSSTALGFNNSVDSSFVERLRNKWVAAGIIDSFINLANGGSDVGAGLPNGTTPLTGFSSPDPLRNVDALLQHPGLKVAIINYPTNTYDQTIITPTMVAQELQIEYNYLIAHGVDCYVTTSQPRNGDFGQTAQDKLAVIKDTILNRFGSHALNFYTGVTNPGLTTQIGQYAQADGIHLNDLGHERLYEIVQAKNIFQNLVSNTAVIGTPATQNTLITGMGVGAYRFQIGIMDGNGLAASALTTITVNALPPGSCNGHTYVITPNPVDSSWYTDGIYVAGDTLLMNDGGKAFTNVVFTTLVGTAACPIIIKNDPSLGRAVKFRGPVAQFALGNCVHVHVTGTGVAGLTYGFDMDGSPGPWTAPNAGGSYVGYQTSGRSSNIEWDHLSTRHAEIGFEVKQDGECDPLYYYPNWVMDSVIIHDCKVQTTWNEGMYIGNTSPDNAVDSYDPRPVVCNGVTTYPRPIRVGYIHVYNCIVDSTGRGGIQLASGNGKGMEVDHNLVTHNGWSGDDAQGTGISFGTYTWPYIHDNIVRNTFTWPIACLGGGFTNNPIRVENNTLDSAGFMQYYIDPIAGTVGANTLQWPVAIEFTTKPVDSLPALDSTQFYIKFNKIGKFKNLDSFAIALDDTYNRMQRQGNYICGNTRLDGITPETNVYNNNDNGQQPIPYFSSCNGFTPPIVDAGGNKTITLPTNTTTLAGSAQITTGGATIISYTWTKQSGPAGGAIASPSAAITGITGLQAGVYVYQLNATDSNGLPGTASVTVTVNAAVIISSGGKIAVGLKRRIANKH